MSQLLLPEEIVSDPRWGDLSLDEKERVTDEYAQDLISRVGPNDPEEYRSGVNKLIDELRSQADPDFLSRQGFVPKTVRAGVEAAKDVVTAVPGMIMFASAKDRGALGVAREMIQQGTTDSSSIIAGLGESNIAGFYANAQLMGENLPTFIKKHTTRAGSALQSRLDELQQRVMDGDHPPIYDEEGKPSIAFRRWLQGQQSEIDELRAKMHGVEQTEGPYSDVLDSPIQPPNPFKAEADPRLLRSSYNNEALLNAIVATARTRNPKYFNLVKNALSMNDEALQLTELSRKAGPKEDEEGNISLWERARGFAQSPIDVATIAIGPEFLVGRALAKGSIKGAAAKAAGIAAGVGTEVSSAAVEEVLSRPFGNELGDVATEAFAESVIGLGIGAGVGRIEAVRERRATDAAEALVRAEENRIARIEELQRKREEIIKNGGRNVELTVTDWRTEKDENGKLKRIPTERTVRAKQILINGELQSKGFSSKSLANRAAKVLERKEEVALFTAKHGDRWFIYQDLDKAESPETRSEARIEFDKLQSRFEDFSFDSLEEANRVGDAALRQNKGIVSQYRARKQEDGTYKIRFSYEAPTPQNEFAQRGIKRAEEINKEYKNRSFKTEEAAIQSAQMLEQASPGAVRFDIAQKNGKYYLKATANTVDISIEGQEIRQNLEAQAARRAEERQARSAFIGDRQAQAQEQADAEAARIDQEKMDQVQREVDQENYENFVQEEAEQKVREYLVGEEFDPSPESIDALFGVEPEQGQLASELSQLTESERAARQTLLESRRRAEQILEERRLAMLGQRPTQPEGQRPMGQGTVPQARRVQERESLQQEQEAERAGIAAQIREDQAIERSGLVEAFHGSPQQAQGKRRTPLFLSDSQSLAEEYSDKSGNVERYYVDTSNALRLTDYDGWVGVVQALESQGKDTSKLKKALVATTIYNDHFGEAKQSDASIEYQERLGLLDEDVLSIGDIREILEIQRRGERDLYLPLGVVNNLNRLKRTAKQVEFRGEDFPQHPGDARDPIYIGLDAGNSDQIEISDGTHRVSHWVDTGVDPSTPVKVYFEPNFIERGNLEDIKELGSEYQIQFPEKTWENFEKNAPKEFYELSAGDELAFVTTGDGSTQFGNRKPVADALFELGYDVLIQPEERANTYIVGNPDAFLTREEALSKAGDRPRTSQAPEERQAQKTRDRISQENALIRDALEDELRSGPDLADDVRNRMMANDARRGRASQAGFIDFDAVFDAAIDAWRFAKGSFQKFAKYMIDKFGQAVNAILPDLWKSTNESIVSRTAQRVQSGNDAVSQNAPQTQQSIPYERAVAEETNDPISAILAENEELNMLTQNPGGERAMGPGDIIPADIRGIQEFQPQDYDIAHLPPDEVTWELVQTAMGLGKVVKGLNRAVNAVTYDGTKLNRAARWALGVLDKRGLIDKDSPDVRALISAMQYHQESGTRVALQNALQRQLRAAIGEPFDVSDSGEVLGLNERTALADLMQEFQSTETGTIDKYGLNDTQVAALRVARHFNQEIQKMLAKEGRLQQYKEENEIEGDNWFTRGTPIDFIEGDQSYMQNRDNGPTPETRHFKLMTFEKGRKFPTQLEGIDAGVVYKNHLGDMLADYYGQALQVISRERFRSKVPTFGIKKQGPKKGQKGVGTFTDVRALQELQNETVANETVFRGFLFDPQTAKVIRESFHDPGSGFQSFDKVNQLGKALIAGFDLSWAAIQLINLWFYDPVKWAKSFNAGIKSLVSAKNANEIYNRADYQQAISELAKLGIQVGVVPEEISGFQSPAKRRNKFVKGLRSVTVDPALRSFQVGVDVAAIEMWLAHKQSKGAMGDQFQVAEMIGNMVGRGKIGEVGISRNQHMIEKLILFSSSYQRSQLNLIASAATGNKYAAAALGRIMIGGAIWGYAAQSLFKALGIAEEEDDDWERLLPWSDKFLRFHVQGNSGRTYQVGINAGWMGYMNLVRKVIDLYNPTNENVGTQSITKLSLQDNILLNFARGKTSPLISNAIDLSLGEDFMGEPLTFGRAVVKNTVPIWLQDLFLEDDNPFTIKAVEALGIGVYNESANRNIRRRMEVMASRRGYSSLEEVPTFREKAEMMFEAAEGNENARYHRMVNSMRDAEGKAKSQGKAKEWNVAWQENQRKKMKEILNQRILDEIAWHNQNDPTYEFGVQVPSFSRDQTVRTKYGNTQYRMDDADTKKFRETYAALFNQHARSLYENAIWKNGAPAERQKIFSKYEDLIKKATLRTLGMQ